MDLLNGDTGGTGHAPVEMTLPPSATVAALGGTTVRIDTHRVGAGILRYVNLTPRLVCPVSLKFHDLRRSRLSP